MHAAQHLECLSIQETSLAWGRNHCFYGKLYLDAASSPRRKMWGKPVFQIALYLGVTKRTPRMGKPTPCIILPERIARLLFLLSYICFQFPTTLKLLLPYHSYFPVAKSKEH